MNIIRSILLTLISLCWLPSMARTDLDSSKTKDPEKNCKTTKGDIILQFKSNGQLISVPPEKVVPGKTISAQIILDELFWVPRINSLISTWIKSIEAMKSYKKTKRILDLGVDDLDIDPVRKEMTEQLHHYLTTLPPNILPTAQKEYYLERIRLLYPQVSKSKPLHWLYAPAVDSLILPTIRITYRFYDKNGIILNSPPKSTSYSTVKKFESCVNYAPLYLADTILVPKGCSEVKYELRIENNQNIATLKWAKGRELPEHFTILLQSISKDLGNDFQASVAPIQEMVKKYKADPANSGVDVTSLQTAVEKAEKVVSPLLKIAKKSSTDTKKWLIDWLWLSGGQVSINPFEPGSTLFASPNAKVSGVDKAKYEIFDNMVSKGVLDIKDQAVIDATIEKMAAIKAAMSAEAAQVTNEPRQQDRLLYNGLLKVGPSDTGEVYMRHLDVANSYIVMGNNPIREITERDRLYILAENKPVPLKLGITFTTAAPSLDNDYLTKNIGGIPGNVPETGAPLVPKEEKDLNSVIERAEKLLKNIAALRNLSSLPNYPIYYDPDATPDFLTQNLEHDYLINAPTVASYSVKSSLADNSEKEMTKGSYRINKLYHLRFKAGLIYSMLKKNDYTQNATTGQFTLDNPESGIDGTFGIQYYLNPKGVDLRSSKAAYRPFLYTGLSMKKITENFYLGAGIEPIGGLAFAVNGHLGKRERLSGTAGVASAIRQSWGIGVAGSILIDAALFVKILTFGSNKGLLGL